MDRQRLTQGPWPHCLLQQVGWRRPAARPFVDAYAKAGFAPGRLDAGEDGNRQLTPTPAWDDASAENRARGGTTLSLRDQVCSVVRSGGHLRLPEPVQLASGDWSRDFVDAKRALQAGADLETACRAMLEAIGDLEFDAVGGMTLGADQFAHVLAVLARRKWFVVRKAPKGRGTNQRVEGAEVGEGVRVLLVDDVVTTGSSILDAYEVVHGLGATITGAVTLLDRGEVARAKFEALGVPYFPVLTYRDLGIEPVGGGVLTR